MGSDRTIVAKEKENLSDIQGGKDKYWMVYSINSKMVVIGVICPAYLPPYSTVFWHYKQWRSQGVLEKNRDVLHTQVRQQVKKKPNRDVLHTQVRQQVKKSQMDNFNDR